MSSADSSATARLYDAHAPALFRFLMTLTGSEADTRDLLQDLFVRLARGGRAESLSDPQAYLFRAARNLAADLARNRSRRRRAMETLAEETAARTLFHPPPEVPDDSQKQLLRRLSTALRSLPEEQRAVVHLKVWENLTFARVAEILNIPPDTAASRHRYALAKLRQALTPATLSPQP